MIDRLKLEKIVFDFRSTIAPLWTEGTAFKVPEIAEYGPNIPGGQCAVTCLVLKDVLAREFPNEPSFLVSGEVRSMDGDVLIPNHAWLKLGTGEEALIIDPTADQSPAIDDAVVIGTGSEIAECRLRYIEMEIESDYGETEHPKRFARYTVLKRLWIPAYARMTVA